MSRIYNILNTLINKVQFKVMSQTIGGENTVEGCLNALNGNISTSNVTTITNGEVAVSGSSSWNAVVTASYTPSAYNWLYIQAGVASAVYESQVVYVPALLKAAHSAFTSVMWDAGNRVSIEIGVNGSIHISSKTQTYKGIYIIKGIK